MKQYAFVICLFMLISSNVVLGVDVEYQIFPGWNLLSYPYADTVNISGLFPFAATPFYYYNNSTASYEEISEISNGVGFWLISTTETTFAVNSTLPAPDAVQVLPDGWSLWGVTDYAISSDALDDYPSIFPPVFGYNPAARRYCGVDTMSPGSGYWVFVTAPEMISLPTGWTTPSTWTDEHSMRLGDDSKFADSTLDMLYDEAARLALREVLIEDSTLIEIPQELIDIYYNGLLHFYSESTTTAWDSAVTMYHFHSFPEPVLYDFLVSLESWCDWYEPWRRGERLTGYPPIDNLMNAYDIHLVEFEYWEYLTYAILATIKPYNINALSNLFEPIYGVWNAHPNHWCCDGDWLWGSIESEFVEYIFSKGWGDCMAGCISRHNWIFHVHYDGTVEFDTSYGDPLGW